MHAEFAETFAAYTRQYTAGRHFSMFLKIVILLPISHYETIFSIIIYESCIYEIAFFYSNKSYVRRLPEREDSVSRVEQSHPEGLRFRKPHLNLRSLRFQKP
jgi:hypothetical protein